MYGYIYKIINKINGKMYIGQTLNIEKRIKDHFSSLEQQKHHSIKLQRAYNKYGKDNFYYEYQQIQIKNLDELLLKEIEEIEKNDSYNNGYNMTKGGEGNLTKLTIEERVCIYNICQKYSGIFNKLSKYFEVDNSVISGIAKNKIYEKYNNNLTLMNEIIEKANIKEENLKEKYIDHTERKLSKDDCLYILSILEFFPEKNYIKTLAQIFNIHNKAIARLRDNQIYHEYFNLYYMIPKKQREKISKIGMRKYDVFHVYCERNRRCVKNPLTQEQVNYILDHKEEKTRRQIAEDLGISDDRVSSIVLGKSYLDLIQKYYENKNSRV